MTLAVREARSAERHALIDRAAVADFGGLADHDAHAVIDEDAFADLRARMDLDPVKKRAMFAKKRGSSGTPAR